jgi:hypothetical protein
MLLVSCAKESPPASLPQLDQRFCGAVKAWNTTMMGSVGVQPSAEERAQQFAPVQQDFATLATEFQALHEDTLARSMTDISAKIGQYRAALVEPFTNTLPAALAVEQAIRDTGIPCPTT